MSGEVDSLIAEVVARPDDDGVRAVLADLLQARNDPRGELISLQLLASRGNRDRDDRIRELLERHARGWLGPLCEAARGCQFDRGFPRRLELGGQWPTGDDRWDTVVGHSVLATVEELIAGETTGYTYRKFLSSAAMVNLRAVEVFDRLSLEGLAECTAAIEHVACAGFTTDAVYAWRARRERRRERRAEWRRARGLDPYGLDGGHEYVDEEDDWEPVEDETDDSRLYFERLWRLIGDRPTITSLSISESYLEIIRPLPWFERIRSLTLGASGSTVRQHLAGWTALNSRRLTIVPNARLEPCDRDYPWDYKIELIPDGDRAIATVSGEWLILPAYVLEALPPEVTRLEIVQSSDERARRIRDVVTRPDVEVILVPLRANNFVWEIR